MIPELHFQTMTDRAAELRAEAAEYRRAREAVAARKARSGGERRRGLGLFRKISAA
ncbi:hypothetical protein GCM10010156_60710 [Planobispora rosea]|uniref:Uncharacterized protein n=1 Tax=Planobispora rosea TaxID=35762 RepID=A0A8J3WFF5_PLARO|nr:hypothetical protein [Planobispora rosea]GGS94286.1 hypothetical protein GCM10010156_60710 [Planobispora rosea]GIH87335.1 hypothetical protein Pro02_57430 [Planobispora rosea]